MIKDLQINQTLKYLIIAIIFLGAVFLLYLSFFKPLAQDEGVFLTIASRILDGKLPYKDFFDHKTPGIYFLFAPLIDLFGKNIFNLKVFLFLNNFFAVFLTFKIAEILKKGTGFFAAILFLYALTFYEANFLIAEPFMVTFLLLGFYFYISKKSAFLTGLFLSLAFLLKQVAIINFVIIFFFIIKSSRLRSNNTLGYLIGFSIPCLITLLYLYTNGLSQTAFSQIITLNLTSYEREPLSLVFSSFFFWLIMALPLWLFFIFGLKNIRGYPKELLLFIFLPLPILFHRHYPHYILQSLPFIAIISAFGFEKFYEFKSITLKIGITLLLFFNITGSLKWYVWMYKNNNLPKLREQKEAAEYLEKNSGKNILAENQFTAFYFLADKEPINKYLYITEINEKENAEEKTIEDLKSKNPIILWPEDPNFAYAKELQNYIKENYKKVRSYPNLKLLILEKG